MILLTPVFAAEHSGHLRVEPYTFRDGSQLFLQTSQRLSNLAQETPWSIAFHLELETELERNRSFDMDRVWIRTNLDRSGEWTWGRIHPWEISLHPSATRPWGLDGSLQSQNRGTLLGEGMNSSRAFPSPLFTGWLGMHYWSDPSGTETFQWGFSLSPIFVPTLGSSFDFNNHRARRQGRFSRNAGVVTTERGVIPLRYEMENSELQSIIFQPQAMAQTYLDMREQIDGLESWAWLSHAPQAEPLRASDDFIVKSTPEGEIALTKPSFPRHWMFGTTTQWTPQDFRDYTFFTTLTYQDQPRYGIEIGTKNRLIQISVLNTWPSSNNDSERYTDLFLQYEGHYPLGRFTPFWGAKHHLRTRDAWFRTGVRALLSSTTELEMGADVFTGNEGTYFGEWRDYDRLYLVFVWSLIEP